jgi:hypothetical protein
MTLLHLLHPQLSESDALDGARSNRNANRIAKFWKKTWFCPGLCQIAIKSKTADSKSLAARRKFDARIRIGDRFRAAFSTGRTLSASYVHVNMRKQLRQFFNNRRRRHYRRPHQMELNLWPKRPSISEIFLRKSRVTRNVR